MDTLKRKIKIIVEKTETGFSAFCEEYPIFTTGKTVTELLNNSFEATQLYFDNKYKITHENLKFEIDFAQFFQYYKVLNSKFLA